MQLFQEYICSSSLNFKHLTPLYQLQWLRNLIMDRMSFNETKSQSLLQ